MKTPTLQTVNLTAIAVGDTNPRKTFADDKIKELAASIAEKGVLQPIVLRRSGDYAFDLVCGERRFRAAKLAGLVDIPASVYEDISDEDLIEMQFTENLHRVDVHPMEEAAAFRAYIDTKKHTADEIAKRLGKTVTYVTRRLRLSDLIPELQTAFYNERLTLNEALRLCKFSEEIQKKIYKQHGAGSGAIRLEADDFEVYAGSLAASAFSLKDPALNPKMGPCQGCKYNTATASLFPEDVTAPRCLNVDCFKIKERNHFNAEFDKAIADPEVVLISTSYWIDKSSAAIKKAAANRVKVYEREEYTAPNFPEFPDIVDMETRLQEGEFATREAMLAEFDKDLRAYNEEVEKYRQLGESGKYIRAFVVCGDHTGKFIFVTLKKQKDAAAGKQAKLDTGGAAASSEPVKPTLGELTSEVARLEQREARAKELDQEKTFPQVYEVLESHAKFKKSDEPLSPVEVRAFIIILFEILGGVYGEDGEIFAKEIGLSKWDDDRDLETLSKFLDGKTRVELGRYVNILCRLLILDKTKPGTNVIPLTNAKAALLQRVASTYDKDRVEEILAAQEEIAKARLDRVTKRIEKLKEDIAEIKGTKPEKKPAPPKPASDKKAKVKSKTPAKKAKVKKPAKKGSKKAKVGRVVTAILLLVLFAFCTPAGTIERVPTPDQRIEVYRYYVADGHAIYIARFKDSGITSTSWRERQGKNHYVDYNTVVLP